MAQSESKLFQFFSRINGNVFIFLRFFGGRRRKTVSPETGFWSKQREYTISLCHLLGSRRLSQVSFSCRMGHPLQETLFRQTAIYSTFFHVLDRRSLYLEWKSYLLRFMDPWILFNDCCRSYKRRICSSILWRSTQDQFLSLEAWKFQRPITNGETSTQSERRSFRWI